MIEDMLGDGDHDWRKHIFHMLNLKSGCVCVIVEVFISCKNKSFSRLHKTVQNLFEMLMWNMKLQR